MIVNPSRSITRQRRAYSVQLKSSRIDEWLLKRFIGGGSPSVRPCSETASKFRQKKHRLWPISSSRDRKTLLRLLLSIRKLELAMRTARGESRRGGTHLCTRKILYPSLPQAEHQSWYAKLVSKCRNMFSATPCTARVVISSDLRS